MTTVSPVLFLSFWVGSILYDQKLCGSDPEEARWGQLLWRMQSSDDRVPEDLQERKNNLLEIKAISHKMLQKLRNGFMQFWVYTKMQLEVTHEGF